VRAFEEKIGKRFPTVFACSWLDVGVEWISFSLLKSRLNNSFDASLSAPSDVAEFHECRSPAKLLRFLVAETGIILFPDSNG
jgi:hypothetical protein